MTLQDSSEEENSVGGWSSAMELRLGVDRRAESRVTEMETRWKTLMMSETALLSRPLMDNFSTHWSICHSDWRKRKAEKSVSSSQKQGDEPSICLFQELVPGCIKTRCHLGDHLPLTGNQNRYISLQLVSGRNLTSALKSLKNQFYVCTWTNIHNTFIKKKEKKITLIVILTSTEREKNITKKHKRCVWGGQCKRNLWSKSGITMEWWREETKEIIIVYWRLTKQQKYKGKKKKYK